ncbi:MAG: chemotaxis protein CheW [Burkholderiales bacterium]
MTNQEELLEELEDMQRGRFLTFDLEEEVFGIEIRFVKEIIGMQPVTKLPDVPDYIKGIINLRGRIIPLIDMRLKLKKPAAEYTDRTCIIVVETAEVTVGLIVDNVSEVLSVGEDNIVPPPDARAGVKNSYISGIGKVGDEIKLLLDCESLFREDEVDMLNKIK